METIERVRRVFAEHFGTDLLEAIGNDQPAFKFGHPVGPKDLDSLDLVEFVMGIEDEFKIAIPDDDAEQMTTIARAAFMVDALVRAQHGKAGIAA
jgi:acyl carrier protein